MNAVLKYKSNSSLSWTRIDMLLLVYDKAISTLSDGLRLLNENRLQEMPRVRLEVQRVLVTIVEGLNPEASESAAQILRLCLFVLDQTQSDVVKGWESSLRIMQTLREGFEGIQEEARLAEHQGQIAPLNFAG